MKAVVSAARASDPAEWSRRRMPCKAMAGRRRTKAKARRAKRAVSGVLTHLIMI